MTALDEPVPTPGAGLRIADVARRSGFSPATLRYYEQIGVLPAPARTDAGYRVYDLRTLDLLGFVARAKELGCSLEEIRELVPVWEGEDCAPVQHRLAMLVGRKAVETRRRRALLDDLAAELDSMSIALAAPAEEGACGPDCPCAAPPRTPEADQSADPPTFACSLTVSDLAARVDEWAVLLGRVTSRSSIPGGVRLAFDPAADLIELARLAQAEQACCRFFSFALTVDSRGFALEVTAPDDGQDVLVALFGAV